MFLSAELIVLFYQLVLPSFQLVLLFDQGLLLGPELNLLIYKLCPKFLELLILSVGRSIGSGDHGLLGIGVCKYNFALSPFCPILGVPQSAAVIVLYRISRCAWS